MRHSKHTVLIVSSALLCLVSVWSALLSAQVKTVWDGVYTDAQAERATLVFGTSCSNCHTLGADGNRPLSGEKFWEGWTQKTVGDLVTYVRTNMPNGAAAGSLPAATYDDLVALILKSNGFPAGATEVSPEAVANVQIIPKDGSTELPSGTLVRVVGCLTKGATDWVLTNATVPQRVDKAAVSAEDATRPLGDRSVPLKFVLTRLDAFVGQRVSASGLLMGAGGKDGLNVTMVNRVAESCP